MNIEVGLTKCFFCGKDKDIIMNTRLTKEAADEIERDFNVSKILERSKFVCNK